MPGLEGLAFWMARSRGNGHEIHDVYDVNSQKVLGVGAFGQVVKGKHKVYGHSCAIKKVPKFSGNGSAKERQARLEALKQEVAIMKSLDHANLIRLYDHFEENVNTYLVMELCAGGKLIDFIARMQEFRESDASILMQQVLRALKYLHDNNIVHRDVKPDNMLLESRSPLKENTLKLVDFGLSGRCSAGQDVRGSMGTPEFISPQAIDGRYDTQTDLWSCGVSLYFLLCGYVPFRAETDTGVFAAVRRGNFTFAAAEWRSVSDNAKDLIRCLLKMNPRDRCTAAEALDHVWITQRAPGGGALLHALSNIRQQSGYRRRPQPEGNVFTAVIDEVTQWANALLPQKKEWPENSLKAFY